MSGLPLTDVAASIVGITAALAAVGWAGRRIWRFVSLSVHAFEDIVGAEATATEPARPGMIARLQAVEHEVRPNGNTSMHDAIRRMEAQLASTAALATDAAAASEAMRMRVAESEARNAEGRGRIIGQVGDLAREVARRDRDADAKEAAYVRALKAVGIDLTNVTRELDREDDR